MGTEPNIPEHGFPALGPRVLVMGTSCSGKSTLAAQIAASRDVPLVELDALNWLPNWVGLNATDTPRLKRRFQVATQGTAWVVAGSYMEHAQATIWPRVTDLVWLDMRMPLLLKRVAIRSWQRHRTRELLWGTNRESFWGHLKVWNKDDSLVWWIATQHHPKRKRLLDVVADPKWSHFTTLRLRSPQAVDQFVATGTKPST